jgi:diguanylate cyclase (GGDEF)-like protein
MGTPSIALAPPFRLATKGPVDTLVELATELAAVTSLDSLREAIAGPLRALLPSRDISVLRAAHGSWEAAIGPEDGPERIHQYSWTPLAAEGKTVGMLGVGAPAQPALPVSYVECATTMLAMSAQSLLAIDNLRQASARDALTGCFTRAHAMELLESNLRRSSRTGLQLSILMIDLDGFKAINDRFGHVPGDALLAEVGARLHRMLRQSDVRCRLGGDEFLVALPDTPIDDALRVAESVRDAIEGLEVRSVRGTIRTTASIGVAGSIPGDPLDVAAFIDRADVALYRAKQDGRNGVQACIRSTSRSRGKLTLAPRAGGPRLAAFRRR